MGLSYFRAQWRHPEFKRGAQEMLGISLGISAWGLVTGVAMVKSGLSVGMALLMSLVVFAGSSQLASLPLIASGAPMWVLWATAFCVNLRFLIFSAQWRLYFGHLPRGKRLAIAYFAADLNYVAFLKRFPEPVPSSDQEPYYWGGVALNWCAWQIPSIAGILLANHVPTEWGLGFAGVLALLGLAYSLLEGPQHLGHRRGGRLRGGGGLRPAAAAEHHGGDCRRRGRGARDGALAAGEEEGAA